MSSTKRILLGVSMTLAMVATAFAQYEGASRTDSYRSDGSVGRNGYSYVRETVGGVTVESRWNGRVTARRNMPISAGDEILVSEAGRAEIGLADGNLLFVGGGTRARFTSLYAQQGENDDFSAIDLKDGSVVLAAMGYDDRSIPRIDTEDATVYLSAGTRVRVNADPRRGTVVVVRAGSAEVRTRLDSYTVDGGQYLMVEGDEPAEISRGVFSRDRFDLWAADRLEELSIETSRSASVSYVDDDYASDVVALDDYGDWEYSSTYSTNVWVPRVSVGWTPYSYGSWYYTPIGLTWWSWDPWGWYPFHYGSWFFDVGFRHWCWAPAYTYSPAWVYWAYTPSYVGWCPVGYYSFYSPWYDTYYRNWGWHSRYHGGLMFAINGNFRSKQIDLGGWNFVKSGSFGSGYDRINVFPGKQIATNLTDTIAISSKAIVVSSRGEPVSQAIQNYVKQAPSMIGRTSKDSSRLAPILAREKTLPAATLQELKDRAVVAGRGKLVGPGADEIASRGMVVERGRSVKEALASPGVEKDSVGGGPGAARGRKGPDRGIGGEIAREAPEVWRGGGRGSEKVEKPATQVAPAPSAGDWRGRGRSVEQPQRPSKESPAPSAGDWRGRGPAIEKGERPAPQVAPRDKGTERAAPAPRTNEDWRGRGRSDAPPRENAPPPQIERQRPAKPASPQGDWRGRSETRFGGNARAAAPEPPGQEWRRGDPAAKRVIEGAVPGRRWQDSGEAPRARESAPPAEWRQRTFERSAPAPREYRGAPAPAPREYRPAPRQYEYKQPPAPREYRPEYRPQPQREYRPAPAPRAPQYSAPPPAPRNESRPAPAPRGDGGFSKGHGKGKG